ncbi:hypothetical protein Lfu02_64890 [Longispora fulva]|uniref:Putative dienelactone hydrolase n=1 Tax=Longispora fulva TaxID=619741 RepID=A0A8J7KQR8_9ACTN|nr:hypothetical protein [Longispora fulva]MBG6137727.1 putative dienelactone hydrolase [Longispora fulva]GIG62117.1 hypothetical protein Lfu02_64890 [Longispora fulva]
MDFVLPPPTGPHPVGVTDVHLTDHGRRDPWLADGPRELMVSVWYPARDVTGSPRAPWLPAGAAEPFDALVGAEGGVPAGTVAWVSPTAGHLDAPARPAGPVVLFSPGLGMGRGTTTTLVSDLASHGYTVVTVDHPGEGSPVRFPDGRVRVDGTLTAEVASDQERMADHIGRALDARIADTAFVLDTLERTGLAPDRSTPDPRGGVGIDRGAGGGPAFGAGARFAVGMFGHSLGGTTACEAVALDPRIVAGANLDGPLGASPTNPMPAEHVDLHGHDRPFLVLGASLSRSDGAGGFRTRSHAPGCDPGWADFWSRHRGWKRDLTLVGAAHHGFTDFQSIYPQLAGPLGLAGPGYERVAGTVDPGRAVAAQRACLLAFFDRFLRPAPAASLQAPDARPGSPVTGPNGPEGLLDGATTGWPELIPVP